MPAAREVPRRGRSEDVMKLVAQIKRIAICQHGMLAVALVVSIAPVLALQGQAVSPVPEGTAASAIANIGTSSTAAPASRLRGVRSAMFREGSRQGLALS